jgi:WD40 repeat protein
VDQLEREGLDGAGGPVSMRLALRFAMATLAWTGAHLGALSPARAASTPELVVQGGHQHQVRRAVFSPDARLIATADIRGPIRLWETASGKQLHALPGHNDHVYGLVLSADGRRLISAGGQFGKPSLVKIWDVETGKELHRLTNHRAPIRDIALSPDGTLLATAGDDDVRLWDTVSGAEKERIATQGDRSTVIFSPDGRLLAIRAAARVRIWAIGRGETGAVKLGNLYGERTVRFTPDGARLAVPDGELLKLIDPASLKVVAQIKIGHDAQIVGFTGSQCVIRGSRGFEVWDITAGSLVRRLADTRWDDVLSPDLRWALALNRPASGSLTLRELGSTRPPVVLAGRVAPAGAVAFSPDGARLATKSGGRFWLWDLRTGEPRLMDGHKAGGPHLDIDALAFTNDGTRIVSGDSLWQFLHWDTASGQVQNRVNLKYDKTTITHACSADGRWCASGQQDRIDVWEVATWRVFRSFLEPGVVHALAISDSGEWIAAAQRPNKVEIWHRPTGQHRSLNGHTDPISQVAFAPGGLLLASADVGGTVRVWEHAAGGREVKAFDSGHAHGVTSLAFSPDGRTLATGGADEVVKLWQLDTGRLLHALRAHVDWVAKLAFSPDGQVLASGSGDGTTRLWDVARGVELALLTAAKDSPDWLVVTPDGLFDGSYVAGETLVAWRVARSAYPPERYFKDFFRPGLLATLWKGDRPHAAVGLQSVAVPPEIQIVPPAATTVKQPRLPLRVRVERLAAEVGLYHNGARVANQPGAPRTPSEYVFDVELVPGDNEIRAVAVSPAGVTSNPDTIRLTYDAPVPARPALYVLAVGISFYRDTSWNLGFARADAEALGGFLARAGGKLFHPVTVKVLTDAAATWPDIKRAIAEIADTARPEDVVLVYFAGHGIAVERRFYLLPHEMQAETTLEDDVRKFGIADAALQDALRKIRAVKRIVILDACESGTALDVLARTLAAQRAALEVLARAEGVFVIAAATRQQEAIEIPELGHGVLTYALLSGLGAKGAERATGAGGVVTMYGLLEYVGRKVPELAARYGRNTRQLPVSFHRGMDFPLVTP